jgi:sugar O-acyltransferase (sialic acid O-acetyltransferase NeuD family)
MKTLGILGSGHLGQQIANIAITDGHFDKVIFFDDFTQKLSNCSFDILGSSKDIISSFEDCKFNEFIIGIGYNHLAVRELMFERFNNEIPFANIIHSSVYIDNSVTIGNGNIIYPGTILDQNVKIKNNNIINIGCVIAHDSTIGSHNFISPRVIIAGYVNIGEQVILGIGTTIIDNLQISNKVKTGGGSIVINNLNKPGLYVGNPARFVR